VIGAGFAEHPRLPEPFPSDRKSWKCPKTGLIVPKHHDEHLKWREKLLKEADRDPVLQKDLLAACKESLLYWVNAFVWTRHEDRVDPKTGKVYPALQTHWPFNTWEIQDAPDGAFNWIEKRFNEGEDGLFDKSRKMGASWLCLTFNHWLWLFRASADLSTEIREMSRIEDLVDSPSPKSLFSKHDYINSWLPNWMRPPGILIRGKDNRTKLRLHNELNGNNIIGEATTAHAMRADRCALILLDEFSQVDNGEQIRTSTTAVAPCRIVNSTTIGAGTEYARWKKSGLIKVFSGLKFWNHPEHGRGRFVLKDEITGRFQISSPYLEQKKLRCSEKELAQEEYGVDLEAGDTFFSLPELDKHIALFARPPKARFNIQLKKNIAEDSIPQFLKARNKAIVSFSAPTENGKLEVWVELINGRPDQGKTYIFGIDTSKGQGASESVVSIKCKQTGELIAKWKCRHTPPYEFARIIVALALWCGGSNPQRLPYLKWENNGPGWDLGRILVQTYKYPYYYKSKSIGTATEKTSDKYGYQMGRESKVLLLRAYERALLQGGIINHDKRGLEQAKYYIYYPGGGVGPAEMVDKNLAEQLLHGDIVIADALTTEDKEVAQPRKKTPQAPFRSFGWRYQQWKRQGKHKGWQRKYSFR
jgi:hypothetical protein